MFEKIRDITAEIAFLAVVALLALIIKNELIALIVVLIGLLAIWASTKLAEILRPIKFLSTLEANFDQAIELMEMAKQRAKKTITIKALMSHRPGKHPRRKDFNEKLGEILMKPPSDINVQFNHLILIFEDAMLNRVNQHISNLKERRYSPSTTINLAILTSQPELIRKVYDMLSILRYMKQVPSEVRDVHISSVPNVSMFIVKADGKYVGVLLGLPQTGQPFGMGPAIFIKGRSRDACKGIEALYDEYWNHAIEIVRSNTICKDRYNILESMIKIIR